MSLLFLKFALSINRLIMKINFTTCFLLFQVVKEMALIMKYIDSMHHYMDKYGGEYRLTNEPPKSHLNCKANPRFVLIAARTITHC